MASILLAVVHAQLDHHNATLMHRIADETSTSDTPIRTAQGATAGGDSKKLRGIPAIGRSVTGAIPGSIPHVNGTGP